MANIQDSTSTSISDLSTSSKQTKFSQCVTTSNQTNYDIFKVHCLSTEKTLKDKKYSSVAELKTDALALYEEYQFDGDDVILTYLDDNDTEVLLTSIPDVPQNGHSTDLFIRFIHPECIICSNRFGVVDKQLLFQCPEIECGAQYCNSCVQVIRGLFSEHPFTCTSCKKKVIPQHNILIEKHLIWKNMCKLYGIQSLLDMKVDSAFMSGIPIVKNIKIRHIHLRSRLDSFQFRIRKNHSNILSDGLLCDEVNDLCMKLEQLVKQIEDIDKEIDDRGIIVSFCLEKYKEDMRNFDYICETLMDNIEKVSMGDNIITTDISDARRQHIKQKYHMYNLDKLSSDHNIKAIDDILQDLLFRKNYLLPHLKIITSLLLNQPQKNTVLDDNLNQVKKKLEMIFIVQKQLNDLRQNLRAIERCVDEYDNLLRDDKFKDILCSKFILLLEKLRVRTEELEMSEYLPQTVDLMGKWQSDYGTGDEFNPKVIDLFIALEMDVKYLLSDHNGIYLVPYKIGVIGHGSVGKSALIMHLIKEDKIFSMVDIERSTFGYLSFDTFIYKHPLNNKIIPITFIDIEGATDVADSDINGSYIELLSKTDCDLYIIAFDKPFDDRNRIWQTYIEEQLKRKCLLVRTKTDALFKNFYQQVAGKRFENKKSNSNIHLGIALNKTKEHSTATFADERLSKGPIYLTAAGCDDPDLKDLPFAKFDLDKMTEECVRLASEDFRVERICKLAIAAARVVINTCFRRSYLLSKTFYKVLAAGASIIPFLDELVSFSGRQKLRETVGIEDKLAIKHKLCGTKDSFEEYLVEKNFKVPATFLKSGYFKYLIPKKTEHTTATSETNPEEYVKQKPADFHNRLHAANNISSSAVRAADVFTRLGTVSGVVVKVLDDFIRIIGPSASVALRAASIAGIVVGAVLTPVFAAWAYHCAGKRMNEHLHRLCDDLVIILISFIIHICGDGCQKEQSSLLSPSNG